MDARQIGRWLEIADEIRPDLEIGGDTSPKLWKRALVALADEVKALHALHSKTPVKIGIARYHRTGGNVGLAWSVQSDLDSPYPADGEAIYLMTPND